MHVIRLETYTDAMISLNSHHQNKQKMQKKKKT